MDRTILNGTTMRRLATAAALLTGTATYAQIPSTAPYYTDPQNEYVQDDTAQGIGSLNMVLCVVGGMDPGDFVNAGPYIALVDVDKCNSKGGGGGNSSSTGATNFANAVVDVTRADSNSPMIAKVWLSMTEQGNAVNVYAYLSATQSPSATSPYGVFRMDYIGKKNNVMGFNGYIDAQPTQISFLEIGPNSSGTQLAMNAGSTTSGSGTMSIAQNGNGGSSTFNFAYDSAYFHRNDGTYDECFDRAKAHASVSVWQYGTYNRSDGTRVDTTYPGFPIQAAYAGASYYGFANYWGINFQGLDLNSLADAPSIPGLAVSDQRPGNTTTYNLGKLGGKLTKWSKATTTLAALDGVPFTFGGDLTNQTSNPSLVTGFGNWVVVWSTANQTFTVTGTQNCGPNGCLALNFPGNATAVINASYLNGTPLMGWSDALGGNMIIPSTGATHLATDAVNYYSQSAVVPGSAGEPTALYCMSQCPTAAALTAFPGSGSNGSPYGNNTAQQSMFADSANTVTYSFGATGLVESAVPMVLEQSSQYPNGSNFLQNGVMTGRLYDAALASATCPPWITAASCVQEPASPSVYYTWQTGMNQWNQSLWLTKTSDGSVVPFDPPQNVAYMVPNDATLYGTWAGKTVQLQFNGFGNLFGVPGYCVNSVDNTPVACNATGARYVPYFSIPDGDTSMSLPGTPLIVKALNAEIRLKNVAIGSCSALTLAPLTLPSGGTHDPSSSSDSEYLGTMPVVTAAPKVIDGVVQ